MTATPIPGFHDHFSRVASAYAQARPSYPAALFDWISANAPRRALAWEAGCGSGQATRGLASRFDAVHASDPSAAQVAQAPRLAKVRFVVEPGERCSLPDASVDAACAAQALHWFDRDRYFAECARVLRPGGVLVAWSYQDVVLPPALAAAGAAFLAEIAADWPPQRADVDAGYAGYHWPFEALTVPHLEFGARWPLPRLLGYFSSFSAVKRHREATGKDPVGRHAEALAAAWGDPERERDLSWPLFVHARRKPD
ncbi:MAG: class I SAM-dependent methyltransferase [Pseudomonadota bacterium]|nr:class I SAM-dependent methyltransferase [Pseudomonadota bacterium]